MLPPPGRAGACQGLVLGEGMRLGVEVGVGLAPGLGDGLAEGEGEGEGEVPGVGVGVAGVGELSGPEGPPPTNGAGAVGLEVAKATIRAAPAARAKAAGSRAAVDLVSTGPPRFWAERR